MGARGAFVDIDCSNFSFVEGGQRYKAIGELSSNFNVKVIMQDYLSVRAPKYSHTADRIYAVIQKGRLKYIAYYDENHAQTVIIDLDHTHKGIIPHKHFYMNHYKNLPRVSPNADELSMIKIIKKEFHLL